MINLYVANTDNDWFDFLSAEQGLTEVNFWWPGEAPFRVLQQGEILAFRLKSPRNKIGGFGVFSNYSLLPIQMAWETFGRANGVSSLEALRNAIAQFRTNVTVGPSTNIGSTVLVQPVFLPSYLWFDVPESWASSIVRGKKYSTDNEEGLRLWAKLVDTAQATTMPPALVAREDQTAFLSGDVARFGRPTLITPRLGQGAFRVAVTEAYGRQCAITNGKVLPALDAAHIMTADTYYEMINAYIVGLYLSTVFAAHALIESSMSFGFMFDEDDKPIAEGGLSKIIAASVERGQISKDLSVRLNELRATRIAYFHSHVGLNRRSAMHRYLDKKAHGVKLRRSDAMAALTTVHQFLNETSPGFFRH